MSHVKFDKLENCELVNYGHAGKKIIKDGKVIFQNFHFLVSRTNVLLFIFIYFFLVTNSNSTSSVRIGNSQTRSFQYARGVRQGGILSPLLFSLYVNNLAFSFNNILSDPFVLPNGTKLHSLFLCRRFNYIITIEISIAKVPKRVILILQLVDAKNKP